HGIGIRRHEGSDATSDNYEEQGLAEHVCHSRVLHRYNLAAIATPDANKGECRKRREDPGGRLWYNLTRCKGAGRCLAVVVFPQEVVVGVDNARVIAVAVEHGFGFAEIVTPQDIVGRVDHAVEVEVARESF